MITAIDMPLTNDERWTAENYVAGFFRQLIDEYPDDGDIDGFQALTAEYDRWFFRDEITEARAEKIAAEVHPRRELIVRYLFVLGCRGEGA